MEWYEKISIKIVDFVEKQLSDTTSDERDRIKYGIEALLVNLGKLPLLFILAYLFGVLKQFSMIFLLYGCLRTFAGGFHAKTSLSCTIISIISFSLMTYLAMTVYPNPLIKIIMFFISIIILAVYAPADNEEKPIVNRKHRIILRIFSYITAGTYITASYLIKNEFIVNTLFYCIIFECFYVSPIPYKIFNRRWRNYEYFLGSYSKNC